MTRTYRLLKEYISLLMEAKSRDTDKIRGSILSQLAEYAVVAGLGNTSYSHFEQAEEKLFPAYKEELRKLFVDEKKKEVIKSIYDKCVSLAELAATKLAMPEGQADPQNQGKVTDAVDVILTGDDETVHEIHVKFNDPERLIGLQAGSTILTAELLSGEVNKNWPSSVLYKYYRNEFARELLGMDQDPAGKSSYEVLQAQGRHKTLRTNRNDRKMFLDYLERKGLPEMILKEVKQFFKTLRGKKVYFFKYKTKGTPKYDKDNEISLDVSTLKADVERFGIIANIAPESNDDVELTPVGGEETLDAAEARAARRAAQMQHAASSRLYTITYNGKPVFVIEARSSSHPLQLKMFSTGKNVENIFDEIEVTIGTI